MAIELTEELRGKIKSRVSPEPTTGCWLWLGSYDHYGYGALSYQRKTWKAHRLAYLAWKGVPGQVIHHKCETPACVNPDHLESVTRAEHGRRHAETRRGVCEKCGIGFEYAASGYRRKTRRRRYCSRACFNVRGQVESTCLFCRTTFLYHQQRYVGSGRIRKYCSVGCADRAKALPENKPCVNRTLSNEEVLRVALEALSGRRHQRKIASDFGVSQSAVSAIVRGKTWPEVTGLGNES